MLVCTHGKITRANAREAMYERPRVNAKVERGSTFTFMRDRRYIVSILFTRVKFTYVLTLKLRNNGNPPQVSAHSYVYSQPGLNSQLSVTKCD